MISFIRSAKAFSWAISPILMLIPAPFQHFGIDMTAILRTPIRVMNHGLLTLLWDLPQGHPQCPHVTLRTQIVTYMITDYLPGVDINDEHNIVKPSIQIEVGDVALEYLKSCDRHSLDQVRVIDV